jgi:uncharacterized membrane protein
MVSGRRRRRISPAARARRALLVDVLAALLLALLVLDLAAGLGVIGFFALPLLAILLLWLGAERLRRSTRSSARRPGRASAAR